MGRRLQLLQVVGPGEERLAAALDVQRERAVDRLRSFSRELAAPARASDVDDLWSTPAATEEKRTAVALAATDPANPYGAALAWPERVVDDEAASGHRPGRKAGAMVVLVDGELAVYVERGGRTLLTFTAEPDTLGPAVSALASAIRQGALGRLTVERADGASILGPGDRSSALRATLEDAGFVVTPRGLRLRGSG